MDKFVVRSKRLSISSTADSSIGYENVDGNVGESSEKRVRVENTCDDDFVSDPALRKPINDFDPQVRDAIREVYMARGPSQPMRYEFPRRGFGNKSRSFQVEWFRKWEWLEYSISEDAAFCFYCSLFKGDVSKRFGDVVFVKTGFRNWKKGTEKFREHEGGEGSAHNKARALFFAFRDQRESSRIAGNPVSDDAYRALLIASVDGVRSILNQAQTFGSFVRQLTCPRVQKGYISACASETRKAIVDEIGDKCFSLLIDEACDDMEKEQMTIVLRYVNNRGVVVERFLGVANVVDTAALSLKSGIDDFFSKNGLSISKVRGHGYCEAFNMRCQLPELRALILNENPCARYIHCFSHQLQLVIVSLSQESQPVSEFFTFLSMIIDMVGAPCKRNDESLQKQHEDMVEKLEKGEVSISGGLNQESTSSRPGATGWGSHYTAIVRLVSMWSSTVQVLENVFHDGTEYRTRGSADSLIEKMESYQFVFVAHLMKLILGLTNGLSQFLQQKDLNIGQAVSLIQNTKRKLQDLRENGWDDLVGDVNSFCAKNDIIVLKMEDDAPGSRSRARRGKPPITCYHYFRVEIFCQVIDKIVQELDTRFSESNTELLMCIACLDPKNSFSDFSESKVLRIAELYPQDFSICDQTELKEQLKMWIYEMRGNGSFSTLQSIGDLAKKMVERGIHTVFHLVYRLIELVLVLPIVTASRERDFSSINISKTDLRNKMGDDFLTDWLVSFTEEDVFKSIDSEVIERRFQNMVTQETNLPFLPLEYIP